MTAVISTYLLRNAPARSVMLFTGIAALVALLSPSQARRAQQPVSAAVLFFAGTAVSGIGFGSGFQGGLRTVVPAAAPHERAGVRSRLFSVSYLGMGGPAVAAGFLAVHGAGSTGAARDYGVALILLAAFALAALDPGAGAARPGETRTSVAMTRPGEPGPGSDRGSARAPRADHRAGAYYSDRSVQREVIEMGAKATAGPTARERLLAAATELFYDEGVHTVGIDRGDRARRGGEGVAVQRLREQGRAGILARPRGPGFKHARITARITRYLERYSDPRERLLGVFEAQGELFSEPGYHGCAFVSASAESPGEGVSRAADDYRGWVRGLLTGTGSAQAGAPDPERLGRQLHMIYDGASLSVARMDHDPAASRDPARAAAEALLSTRRSPPGDRHRPPGPTCRSAGPGARRPAAARPPALVCLRCPRGNVPVGCRKPARGSVPGVNTAATVRTAPRRT